MDQPLKETKKRIDLFSGQLLQGCIETYSSGQREGCEATGD